MSARGSLRLVVMSDRVRRLGDEWLAAPKLQHPYLEDHPLSPLAVTLFGVTFSGTAALLVAVVVVVVIGALLYFARGRRP